MGRTEADRKITNEPWSSMRRGQKTTTKTTLRSEGSSVLKKDLTGPTLLEMSGFRVYKDLSSHPSRKPSGRRPPTMYNPPPTPSLFERNARKLRPHPSCVSRRYRRLFRLRLRHVLRPAPYQVRIPDVPQRLPLAQHHDD